MSLKDTLASLRLQEQRKAQWETDRPGLIKEWQDAVTSLSKEIRGYLAEYEANRSMSFSERQIELSEEQLGKYHVTEMSIVAGPATIMVAPVGRMIIGAQGRVDMYRQGYRGEQDRIVLLRLPTSPTDPTLRWTTRSPLEAGIPKGKLSGRPASQLPPHQRRLVPLDKVMLEQHLDYLLSK